MDFFEKFSSNTIAGSGNQFFFTMAEGEVRTGQVFFKIANGGNYGYSLLFSNVTDSTYADGSVSTKNTVCDTWTIHSAKIGICSAKSFANDPTVYDADVVQWTVLTFNGKKSKEVQPGEFFASDRADLSFNAGEYLCLELTFSGTKIPCHEESLLPVFVKRDEQWVYSREIPFPGMIGCDRAVKARIGFWGDSITQGIGTGINTYLHWNALLAEKLGNEFACWNLGIGFARASDAASLGAWYSKAVQNDIVFVCFGVNDLLQGASEEQIKDDLNRIVTALKDAGRTVILQTLPPFDYSGDLVGVWERINTYIKTVLAEKVRLVFDEVPYIGMDAPWTHMAKYGGHPNAEGCAIWADALYNALQDPLQ